jgi:hypothetical protein
VAKVDGSSKSISHRGRTTSTEQVDLGWTHRVTVEGVDYFVDERALSALDDAALQKVSDGVCNLRSALSPQPGEVSLLTIASLMWLSERQHVGKPDFRQIAGGLKLGMEIDLELRNPDEDDDSPEA